MLTVKIIPNDTNNPPGKLADAELHFNGNTRDLHDWLREYAATCPNPIAFQKLLDTLDGLAVLDGLKLIGFGIWERRTGNGRNVTFPARTYSVNGERRSVALLRPSGDDATGQTRIRVANRTFHAFDPDAAGIDRLCDLILRAYAELEERRAVAQGELPGDIGTMGHLTGRL